MAPRKPKTKDQAAATQLPKATTGTGVVKRQYKKVRFLENGLLDVERKAGKFLKIVEQNQRNSPLLRLPPEIRNQIYGYVLGGNTFKIGMSSKKLGSKLFITLKSQNTLALLVACRQTYAETALLPFKLNTFSSNYPEYITKWFKNMLPIYTGCVRYVQVDVKSFKPAPFDILGIFVALQYQSAMTGSESDWSFQSLKSLRCICISMIALDQSGNGLDVFLPKVIQDERDHKAVTKSQNPGVPIIMERKVVEKPLERF